MGLLLLALIGCGSEEEKGGDVPTIDGTDMTGTYRAIGVECYNSNGPLSAAANFTEDSPVETITIDGNSFESSTVSNSCTVRISGRMVFTAESDTSSGGYGTMAISYNPVEITGGSPCSYEFTWDLVDNSPNIIPASKSATYSDGDTISDNSSIYLYNSSHAGLLSVLQVSGSPTDLCFMIYRIL